MKWEETDKGLIRTLEFKTFRECFGFAAQVALLAEKHQHHPDISISFNILKLRLITADEGGIITSKDRDMAERINKIRLSG